MHSVYQLLEHHLLSLTSVFVWGSFVALKGLTMKANVTMLGAVVAGRLDAARGPLTVTPAYVRG
jgi:hypothetical protein